MRSPRRERAGGRAPRTDPGGARRGRPADRRRAALGLPARRRHHHAAPDGAARLRGRRPRRRADGQGPVRDLPRDLRRHGPELAVPVDLGRRPRRRRAEPAADADPHRSTHPHRPGRRLRVPVRAVQHRRPGPVPRRLLHGRLARLGVRVDAGPAAHRDLHGRRVRGRSAVGRDRRIAEGHDGRQRGDHDDHAQLDRDLDRHLAGQPQRAASEHGAEVRPCVARHRRGREAARLLGGPGAAGPPHRALRRARRAARVLGAAQPDGHGLRGARGRLQPRRGPCRGHLRGAQLRPRDGHLRSLRGPRRVAGRARLAVPGGAQRHRDIPDRLSRHRGRASRAQHRGRDAVRRTAVRRLADRDVGAQPRPAGVPARAGDRAHLHHPGPDRAARQRGHPRRVPVAVAKADPQAGLQAAGRRGGARMTARRVGWAGIALGFLAFFVAVPPLTVRTPIVPIVIGLLGMGAGVWAVAGGARRVGWGAIAAAAVGIAGGIAATQSGVGNLERVVVWSALFAAMLRYATPLIFASLGGLFSERSGVINIALEGMLLTGAFFAVLGADLTGTWFLGVLIGMAAGGALALIHAIFAVSLRADQIVSGTALNFLAFGLTTYLYLNRYGGQGTPTDLPAVPDVQLPLIEGIPFFGDIFGQVNLLIWMALALVVITWVVVFRTPPGLRLRSSGENPLAAETAGLSVVRTRYLAVVTSGMLAGAGGAYLSIGFVHSFSQNMTVGKGFIALAALIFGRWRPGGALMAALLFGFSTALAQRLPVFSPSAATLFQALPYVLTLIAVAGVVGRSIAPAALGRPLERS